MPRSWHRRGSDRISAAPLCVMGLDRPVSFCIIVERHEAVHGAVQTTERHATGATCSCTCVAATHGVVARCFCTAYGAHEWSDERRLRSTVSTATREEERSQKIARDVETRDERRDPGPKVQCGVL